MSSLTVLTRVGWVEDVAEETGPHGVSPGGPASPGKDVGLGSLAHRCVPPEPNVLELA